MTRRIVRPLKVETVSPVETPKYGSYQEYLASPRWAELRERALERDGRRCRVCNSSKRIQGHHRKYPKVWGEETIEDITTLCHDCHEFFSLRKPVISKKKKPPKKNKATKRDEYGVNQNVNHGKLMIRVLHEMKNEGLIKSFDGVSLRDAALIVYPTMQISDKNGYKEKCRYADILVEYLERKPNDQYSAHKAVDDLYGI